MTRVGISGWHYPRWRGTFYPTGLPQRDELAYAAARLGTIELNGSFYALQRPTSYQQWAAQTPADFVLSVKGGRFVTHIKKLADVEAPLANFFASGLLALGHRLGPVLWQLPPTLPYDPERLAAFFALLPRTTAQAAELAAHHDARLDGRAWTTTDADRPLHHALEVRGAGYVDAGFVELLRAHDVALVVADSAGRWPRFLDVTSDIVYVRLHGHAQLYESGYPRSLLEEWAARIRAWSAGDTDVGDPLVAAPAPRAPHGREVYVYFDNDAKVHAPFDAMALTEILHGDPPRGGTG